MACFCILLIRVSSFMSWLLVKHVNLEGLSNYLDVNHRCQTLGKENPSGMPDGRAPAEQPCLKLTVLPLKVLSLMKPKRQLNWLIVSECILQTLFSVRCICVFVAIAKLLSVFYKVCFFSADILVAKAETFKGSNQSFQMPSLHSVAISVHCHDFRWIVTDDTIPVIINMKNLHLSI